MIQKLGKWAIVAAVLVGLGAVALLFVSTAEACGKCGCRGGGSATKTLLAKPQCSKCGFSKASDSCGTACKAATKLKAVGVKFLTAKSLKAKIRSGQPPILINVLPSKAYVASRIKGSISIPYTQVSTLAPKILPDKTAEIVVYCGSYKCGASVTAATALKKLGYTNVSDYKGGMKEWTSKGLPLEGAPVVKKGKGA